MSTPHTATIRKTYDAFAAGDVPAVLDVLAPECRWTEAEGFPYAGTYVGPEAVLRGVFMRLGADWDQFQAVPDQFISEADTVVALGAYSGRCKANGRAFVAPFAHVWTFDSAGRVARFVQHTDTAVVQRAMT